MTGAVPPYDDGFYVGSPVGQQRRRHRVLYLLLTVAAVVAVIAIFASLSRGVLQRAQLPPLEVGNVMDEVVVSGRQGAAPVLDLREPLQARGVMVREQLHGDGREIQEGTPVLLAVSSFDGADGTNLQPEGLPNLLVEEASESGLGSTLAKVVVGSTEGSRFVLGRELSDGKTEVNVVDVLYTVAKGTPVESTDGPLKVELTDAGPVISHPEGPPPEETSVQVLIQGNGPQVKSGDKVVAQFLAVNWTDGETIASTWSQGTPRIIELEDAMPGLRDVLVDRRVGSRLAAVIPADRAAGDDALCVLVDILGVMPGK